MDCRVHIARYVIVKSKKRKYVQRRVKLESIRSKWDLRCRGWRVGKITRARDRMLRRSNHPREL